MGLRRWLPVPAGDPTCQCAAFHTPESESFPVKFGRSGEYNSLSEYNSLILLVRWEVNGKGQLKVLLLRLENTLKSALSWITPKVTGFSHRNWSGIFTTQQIALSKCDIMPHTIYQTNYIQGGYKTAHQPASRLVWLVRASTRASTAQTSQPSTLHKAAAAWTYKSKKGGGWAYTFLSTLLADISSKPFYWNMRLQKTAFYLMHLIVF